MKCPCPACKEKINVPFPHKGPVTVLMACPKCGNNIVLKRESNPREEHWRKGSR